MLKFIIITLFIGGTLFAASTILSIYSQGEALQANSDASIDTGYNKDNYGSLEGAFRKLISIAKKDEDKIRLRGEDTDQINFLFLGVGGEEHISGNYLTDTIILITFVPSTQKFAVISIPRDFMVRSPNKNRFTKINSLYSYPASRYARLEQVSSTKPDPHGDIYKKFPGPMGVEYTKETIKNITGVEIDYYSVLDLKGVEGIVDILGGIYVRRFEDLKDKSFPDDNFGYETYEIDEGWRYLNGEEAVKYIRTRNTPGGDFDRMKRQHEVALSIKKKIEGLQSLSALPKLLSLYDSLQDHFTTDLTFSEIMRLMKLAESKHNDQIIFYRLTTGKDGLLVSDTVIWNGKNAYVLKPKAGTENFEEIKSKIASIIESLKNEE